MEEKKPYGVKTTQIDALDTNVIRAGDAYLMQIKSSENEIVIGFCDDVYRTCEHDVTSTGAHFIFRTSSHPKDTIAEMNVHVDDILSGEVRILLHYSAECYERHAYAVDE